MKRIINIFCVAAALTAGLWSCQQKEEGPLETVDLRYRCESSYELDAIGAKSFSILVASSKDWTVTSAHPDWCIITQEEGVASDPDLLRVGQAEATLIRVQYYDNIYLDDRDDIITIESAGIMAKKVSVHQKGIAFLTIPEEDLDQEVAKAGGEHVVHILSNQKWSVKVTDGDWISISEGATGEGEGSVTLTAVENPLELRYAQATVYDRHDKAAAYIQFTQDGVQLVPASTELRAGFDQLSGELDIVSNTRWVVRKASDSDTWFTLENASGSGNGKVTISLTKNEGTSLRSAQIIITNVIQHEGDAQVEKEITIKQAYEIVPVRTLADGSEGANWKADQSNAAGIVYNKDLGGVYFPAPSRWNRSMDFGTYTFRWSSISPGARVRHWFCFSDGVEIKADLRPASAKVSFDFNADGSGISAKPSVDAYADVDFTQPVELTYKFDPSGAQHCHVTFLVNGVEAGSFDSSPEVLYTVTWGAKINMYFGVYEEGEGSSAVLEWYEYTAPVNWDE